MFRQGSEALGVELSAGAQRSAPSFFQSRPRPLFVDQGTCSAFFTPGCAEENVYHLADFLDGHKLVDSLSDLYIVFISSASKETILWAQAESLPQHAESGQVTLDFHCVLLQNTYPSSAEDLFGESTRARPPATKGLKNPDFVTYVWDLESTLALPTRLAAYSQHALRTKYMPDMGARYQRMYRVVPAEAYMQHFASTRQHHPRRRDDNWVIPKYKMPQIQSKLGITNAMHRYLDMVPSALQDMAWDDMTRAEQLQAEQEQRYGRVLDEGAFLAEFGVIIPGINA